MVEQSDTDLKKKLALLEEEHEDLDFAIHHLQDAVKIDEFRIGRIKKRKLLLKDTITRLKSQLIPDEPA